MKNYLLLLLLIVLNHQVEAQRIEYDIFNNLEYESKEKDYSAYLKKDVFDNIIFSDSNGNELTFHEDYLEQEYENLVGDKEQEMDFFRYLIYRYRFESGYKASFDINISNEVIIEDNRNNRIEFGTDIFGYPTYEEKRNETEISIKRNVSGSLEYKSGKEQAFLKKDIFGKWNYSDSSGNEFEFGKPAWRMLKKTYVSEENILLFLLKNFLH